MSSCRIDSQGRVVLPATWRESQNLAAGTELLAIEEDGRLILQTRKQAVKEAQEMLRELIGTKKSLVDDLLRERRREAAGELRRGSRRKA